MKKIKVAAAVIRRPDGMILATERGYGDLTGKWEFPGGKLEPGETGEQAAVREIREEMDAKIRVEKLLTTIEYDYPDFHLSMQCFLCSLESDFQLLEHKAAKWCSQEELNGLDWCPADRLVVKAIMDDQEIR